MSGFFVGPQVTLFPSLNQKNQDPLKQRHFSHLDVSFVVVFVRVIHMLLLIVKSFFRQDYLREIRWLEGTGCVTSVWGIIHIGVVQPLVVKNVHTITFLHMGRTNQPVSPAGVTAAKQVPYTHSRKLLKTFLVRGEQTAKTAQMRAVIDSTVEPHCLGTPI